MNNMQSICHAIIHNEMFMSICGVQQCHGVQQCEHMWLILPTLPLESHTLLVIPLIQLSCKCPCPWSITSLSFQYFHILYNPHSLDPWFQLEADSPHGSICISLALLSAVTLVFLAIPTYWSTFSPSSFGNECMWSPWPLIPNLASSSPIMLLHPQECHLCPISLLHPEECHFIPKNATSGSEPWEVREEATPLNLELRHMISVSARSESSTFIPIPHIWFQIASSPWM